MSHSIVVAAGTDQGLRRAENQDAVLVHEYADAGGETAYLLAVADGMSGVAGGREASTTAIAALQRAMRHRPSDPAEALAVAMMAADVAVQSEAGRQPALAGMGTTLVAAFVTAGRAWFANVGDSRGYLMQRDGLRRVTRDHSWVAEQVRAGALSEEEAASHPRRNIITRVIGSLGRARPDVFPAIELQSGYCVLLSSDGLHGVVPEDEIAALCRRHAPAQAVDVLIASANRCGGPDNISAVLAAIGEQPALPGR